jgi:hypothetical protein
VVKRPDAGSSPVGSTVTYKERLKLYRARADVIYAKAEMEKKARTNKRMSWFEDHSLTTAPEMFRARFGPEKDINNVMIWRQLMIETIRRAQDTKQERDWELHRIVHKEYRTLRDASKQAQAEAQEKLRKFQLECRTLSYGDDGQAGQGVSAADPRGLPGPK